MFGKSEHFCNFQMLDVNPNQSFQRSSKVHSKLNVQHSAMRSVTGIFSITLHWFEMDFSEPAKWLIAKWLAYKTRDLVGLRLGLAFIL